MRTEDLTVAVIGGGIGGTAVATALAQRGADVTLYEQAPELSEVGAGLQISTNGQRVLQALGAVSGPPEGTTVSDGTVFCDASSGRDVARVVPPRTGPTWYMHRADLLNVLVRAADRAGVKVELGKHLVPGSAQADLVIAADGGRSNWRSAIDGPDRPQFTGQVAWRALVPCDPGSLPPVAQLFMGTRAHVVLYPLRGGTLANLVAIEERHGWIEEGWNIGGDPAEFQRRFVDFRGAAGEIIGRTKRVHQWALHLRPVAERWHDANTALLGDAAHPTLPFLAQGACLALEDSLVLAAAVQTATDMPTALALYQSERQARATRIVGIARGNAWRFHLPKPWAWAAHLVLRLGAGHLSRRLEWVYDYDAGAVISSGSGGSVP